MENIVLLEYACDFFVASVPLDINGLIKKHQVIHIRPTSPYLGSSDHHKVPVNHVYDDTFVAFLASLGL